MATQESYNNALVSLTSTLDTAKGVSEAVREYWAGKLQYASTKALVKGSVQSTLSNPLAYYMVPLSGNGTGGRSHSFTLDQFEFSLIKGWTGKADKELRGVNPDAIQAGLTFSRARKDSALGTKEDRLAASKAGQSNKELIAAMLADALSGVKTPAQKAAATRAARKAAKDAPPTVDATVEVNVDGADI